MYNLWKITEKNGKGDPSDESESWETSISYDIVSEEEADSHNERMINDYEYQDYSHTVDYTKIATFYDINELKQVLNAINGVVSEWINDCKNPEKLEDVVFCKYCGKPNGSSDEDLLCDSCRESFGHSKFSEL